MADPTVNDISPDDAGPASRWFGYPVTSHFRTTAAGARMHYLDEGPRDAPVVVFVHGNPTWCFAWRHLVSRLRDRFRCIVPDHVGMGLSDKPEQYPYVLPRRVRDLADLLDHCGVDRCHLVVHDWGGMIGTALAVQQPDRFDRLVVMNTAAFPLPPERAFMWQLTACRLPGLGPLLVRGLNGFCRYAIRHCVARRPLDAATAAGYLAPYDSWSNRVAVHRFVADIPLQPQDQWYDYVAAVDQRLPVLCDHPMLLAWGLRDFVFDRPFLEGWRRRFPAAAVHEFADCGHYLFEDARQELDRLVPDFLDQATA